jgi:hypothetical protein
MDNRIVWGGHDAVYHFGGKVKAGYEDRPASYRPSRKYPPVAESAEECVDFGDRIGVIAIANSPTSARDGLRHRRKPSFGGCDDGHLGSSRQAVSANLVAARLFQQ